MEQYIIRECIHILKPTVSLIFNWSLLTIYKSSSSSNTSSTSSSIVICCMLVHSSVLHPQSFVQYRVTRLHEQFPLLQLALHAHLIRCKIYSGATGKSVVIGVILSTLTFQPYSKGSKWFPNHSWIWWYTRNEWYPATDDEGGNRRGSTFFCIRPRLLRCFYIKRFLMNKGLHTF